MKKFFGLLFALVLISSEAFATDIKSAPAATLLTKNNTWTGTNAFSGAVTIGGTTISPVDVQTFNASGTWTKPSTGTAAFIQCWGGGGSGGKLSAGTGGGAGGGGGAYNHAMIKLSSLGATETVTIGAGGTAQTVANTDGNAGGNTTFGSWLTAYGGGGGDANAGANGGYGGGGGGTMSAGNVGGVTAIPADITTLLKLKEGLTAGLSWGGAPDAGHNAIASSTLLAGKSFTGGGGGGMLNDTTYGAGGASVFGGGGGGGGAYQTQAAGAGGNSVFGGGGGGGGSEDAAPGAAAGGASQFGGNGGAGAYDANAATAGTQPGGGGGGSESGTSGAGGDGRCIVTVW